MKRRDLLGGIAASALVAPHMAGAAFAAAGAAKPAPLSALIKAVNIPYKVFTLDNGLRVIVHTDRKAPIVGVTVYYRVGSKHEPEGKTGFAHLFEHLMFGGSENVPNFDEPLTAAGSTPTNGSTWYDRTNYVETVPTGALDLALFMEADRMGRLLGAVTQPKLDAQRGVVQNEKRQGDNQPYGLVEYAQAAALFPKDHPYGHSTIGSMADLDAASLEDVHEWFKDHYGPNNAILSLAGDIDEATARAKVEKWFGDIPRGKPVAAVSAPIPTLPARVEETMQDRVSNTRLYRNWIVPGLGHKDNAPLTVAASVLGGLASSRLDNAFVRGNQTAISVNANLLTFEQLGQFEIEVNVKPGADASAVSEALDALVADFIKNGPTKDEVDRVVARTVADQIAGLEMVGEFGGKSSTLAEGLLYAGDPGFYKKNLTALAAVTPKSAIAAMQAWLSRPVYALRVDPGERPAYENAEVEREEITAEDLTASLPEPTLSLPEVVPTRPFEFPAVESTTLSNGVTVHLARRTAVPMVNLSLSFDAGIAADDREHLGVGQLMLNLLSEGTTTRSSVQIAEEQERLGASITTAQGLDRASVSLQALTANLGPSLDLLADMVLNPAFAPEEVERLRAIQVSRVRQEKTQPAGMAERALSPLLYGPNHPYGVPTRGQGEEETVAKLTPSDLRTYLTTWFRPETVQIFAVGDITLAALKAELETRFGTWAPPSLAKGVKRLDVAIPATTPGITVINRPQSPQSYIMGGFITPVTGKNDLVAFEAANNILGNDFLSRINVDIREVKGWSYGARAVLMSRLGPSPYMIMAPVQADKTGPAIAAITDTIKGFLGDNGVTPVEFTRVIKGNIAQLAARYETSPDVLGQMRSDALFGRPFTYVSQLAARYAALTPEGLSEAARAVIDPAQIRWVVVGDEAEVLPQLEALGLPVNAL